jgi:hypothetical protein
MSRLAWALLLCVAIDFSDPLLPGAVRLDPAESIQAVPTRSVPARTLATPPLAQRVDRSVPREPAGPWRSDVARLATIDRSQPRVSRVVRHHPDERTIPAAPEDH